MPPKGTLRNFVIVPSDGCPTTANLLSLDANLAIRRVSSASKSPDCVVAHWSNRSNAVAPPSSVFGLGFVDQPRTHWFSREPPETPRNRCSLLQSSLMTRLPRSPGSTLVLRLNKETAYDFILPFLPPCGPHLTSLATGSFEPSLLVFSTPGGLTATTFRTCFSPVPTPVKSQPTPAILSQE
jgi:hypothetical protein